MKNTHLVLILMLISTNLYAESIPVYEDPSEDLSGYPGQVKGNEGYPNSTAFPDAAELVQQGTKLVSQSSSNPVQKVKDQANSVAKSIGKSLGEYVKQKNNERKQRQIVGIFDETFWEYTRDLDLSPSEREYLLTEVENAYIRDSEREDYKLDQVHFSDLRTVIKKEYSEMNLEKTRDGIVDTYYPTGELKTRWELKDGDPHGAAVTHYEDGEIKYIDVYEKGKRMSRKKYDPEGRLIFEQAYAYTYEPKAAEHE